MGKEIRVAIVGLGNCASTLIQGLTYYRNVSKHETVPGLMHPELGGYKISDIKVVAAFDVNRLKIGHDISEAIFAHPNVAERFADVEKLGVDVQAGPILDGVAPHMFESFHVYGDGIKPVDPAKVLEDSGAEILINYLPVGSREATRFYVEACLNAGCALVNCIPEFIASDRAWADKFWERKLPVAGDDVKSQVGATIVHRALVNLMLERGVKIEETYQLNVGGDTDFENMLDENRLASKRISKTQAVTSLSDYQFPTRIGPSDWVSFLGDKKICYIYIRGRKFGDRPITLDLKLSVEDSPNSGGVVIDVIRATKLALERGVSGSLDSISSYAFKHPPVNIPDHIARQWVEEFIQGKRER
nr:inositol-3-phosphate synthase [Candidatus Njordarchaeota archaeon]